MRELLLALCSVLTFLPASSQSPGSPDLTFGAGGTATYLTNEGRFSKMAIQPDGKLVGMGQAFDNREGHYIFVARYNIDGTLDKSFSNNGIISEKEIDPFDVGSIAVQQDGKIVLSATIGLSGEDFHKGVALIRYNNNGTRDNTFGTNGMVTTTVITEDGEYPDELHTSIAVLSNQTILIAADLADHFNLEVELLFYNTNGSLSHLQNINQDFSQDAYTQISAYKDGGYVLSTRKADGNVYLYSSRFGEKTVNYKSDPENIFGDTKHHILNSGKVAVAAQLGYATGFRSFITLLNADGSPDTQFADNGFLLFQNQDVYGLSSEPNGKLLASLSNPDVICRYNADGTLDAGFGNNGRINFLAFSILAYGNRLYASADPVSAFILSTDARTVKVNLYGNTDPYTHREWNNWNNLRNRHFDNFYYSDSTASAIDAVMSNRTGVNDNGVNYGGSNTLMAPKGVLRHSSYSTSARTVTLSSLAPSKKYDLEFYSSRNDQSLNSTVFTINGVVQSVSTYRNYAGKVVFSNLTPDAQGRIVVSIQSSKTYNYLNGFILTEKFNSTVIPEAVVDNSTESRSVEETKTALNALVVNVFPNPAQSYFTLKLQSKSSDPVQLRMITETGRVVEQKVAAANSTQIFGASYKPGVYFIEAAQGTERKLIKVLKAN